MSFVVEDGTGLSTANALASVAFVDTFWTDRGGNAAWAGATAVKEAAIVKATDYLMGQLRYRWRGTKKTAAQALMWPRTGAYERDGQAVAETIVPARVQQAVAFLAPRLVGKALEVELPDLDRGGRVTSKSIAGVISTSYADDAPIGKVIQYVDGLLMPLLHGSEQEVFAEGALEYARIGLPDIFQSDWDAPHSESSGKVTDAAEAWDEGEM